MRLLHSWHLYLSEDTKDPFVTSPVTDRSDVTAQSTWKG